MYMFRVIFIAVFFSLSLTSVAQEQTGQSCLTCNKGGTLSGVGGDGKSYSAQFAGGQKICPSSHYSNGATPFVHFSKDGEPFPSQNWGVRTDSYKIVCAK